MRRIVPISVLMCFIMTARSSGQKATQNTSTAEKVAIAIPAERIKWVQVRPGQETSALWGDRSVGPYGSFNRFAA